MIADRHWHALAARIEEQYASRTQQLATGIACSYEDYRYRAGYLAALRDIGKWSEEIAKSMDAKPPMREV